MDLRYLVVIIKKGWDIIYNKRVGVCGDVVPESSRRGESGKERRGEERELTFIEMERAKGMMNVGGGRKEGRKGGSERE